MSRYLSRHCTFAAPDDWVAEAPFGLTEPRDDPERLSAQVLEAWLEAPTDVAAYARRQKEILPHLVQRLEVLQEGPFRTEGGSSGYAITLRGRDDDDEPLWQRRLYLAQGPLVAELTLSAQEAPNPAQAKVLEMVARSFSLHGVEPFAKTASLPLAPRLAEGKEALASAPRRSFPYLCVSVPAPAGWELGEETATAVLHRGGAEVRLHRLLDTGGDVGAWFAQRMAALQESGSELLASQQGELEDGRAFAAVLADEGSLARRWSSAADRQCLEVMIDDRQALLWSLRAHPSTFADARGALEAAIAGTSFLPEEQWRTKLPERWLDVTLAGAWRPQDEGLYARLEPSLAIVYLTRTPSTAPLEKLRPSLVGSLRQTFAKVDREQEGSGMLAGLEACRLALDGIVEDTGPLSLRGGWLASGKELLSIVVHARERETADETFRQLLDGVRPDQARAKSAAPSGRATP